MDRADGFLLTLGVVGAILVVGIILDLNVYKIQNDIRYIRESIEETRTECRSADPYLCEVLRNDGLELRNISGEGVDEKDEACER